MKLSNVRFIRKFEIILGVKIEMSDGSIFYAEDCTTKDLEELCWKDKEIDNFDIIYGKYFCYDAEYVYEYNEGETFEKFLTFEGTFKEWNEWLGY